MTITLFANVSCLLITILMTEGSMTETLDKYNKWDKTENILNSDST